MNGNQIFLVIFFVFYAFAIVRIIVMSPKRLKAIDALHKYNLEKIRKGEFETPWFYDIALGWGSHMLQFWKWSKYSTFKDEYYEIMKPYFD